MPLYDYDCANCGRRFEVLHSVTADGPTACPSCGGGPVRKAISAPAVHFKGSGWAKKERRATASPGTSKPSGDGSSDGGGSGSGSDSGSDKDNSSSSGSDGGDASATKPDGGGGSSGTKTSSSASTAD